MPKPYVLLTILNITLGQTTCLYFFNYLPHIFLMFPNM